MEHGPEGVDERGGRRPVAAFVAIVVFLAAGAFAWRAFEPVRDARPIRASSPTAQAEPWAGYAEGWTELPPPPVVRTGAALVWTGSELLLWGGYDDTTRSASSDGYAFDPLTLGWTAMPPAPMAREYPHGVWTGREVLFWGGRAAKPYSVLGAGYDPIAQTWRVLAPPPADEASVAVGVWTGSELIVWGGGRGSDDNVPFADVDLASASDNGELVQGMWPWATMKALPPGGIVIVAGVYPTWERMCCGHYPAAELPLQLVDAEGGTGWEGEVRPDVPMYTLLRNATGRDIEFRIFFGAADPSAALLSEAQAEIDRLQVPPLPSVAPASS